MNVDWNYGETIDAVGPVTRIRVMKGRAWATPELVSFAYAVCERFDADWTYHEDMGTPVCANLPQSPASGAYDPRLLEAAAMKFRVCRQALDYATDGTNVYSPFVNIKAIPAGYKALVTLLCQGHVGAAVLLFPILSKADCNMALDAILDEFAGLKFVLKLGYGNLIQELEALRVALRTDSEFWVEDQGIGLIVRGRPGARYLTPERETMYTTSHAIPNHKPMIEFIEAEMRRITKTDQLMNYPVIANEIDEEVAKLEGDLGRIRLYTVSPLPVATLPQLEINSVHASHVEVPYDFKTIEPLCIKPGSLDEEILAFGDCPGVTVVDNVTELQKCVFDDSGGDRVVYGRHEVYQSILEGTAKVVLMVDDGVSTVANEKVLYHCMAHGVRFGVIRRPGFQTRIGVGKDTKPPMAFLDESARVAFIRRFLVHAKMVGSHAFSTKHYVGDLVYVVKPGEGGDSLCKLLGESRPAHEAKSFLKKLLKCVSILYGKDRGMMMYFFPLRVLPNGIVVITTMASGNTGRKHHVLDVRYPVTVYPMFDFGWDIVRACVMAMLYICENFGYAEVAQYKYEVYRNTAPIDVLERDRVAWLRPYDLRITSYL